MGTGLPETQVLAGPVGADEPATSGEAGWTAQRPGSDIGGLEHSGNNQKMNMPSAASLRQSHEICVSFRGLVLGCFPQSPNIGQRHKATDFHQAESRVSRRLPSPHPEAQSRHHTHAGDVLGGPGAFGRLQSAVGRCRIFMGPFLLNSKVWAGAIIAMISYRKWLFTNLFLFCPHFT